jgi:two-component system chemotaxis response regulator CheV
LLVFRVGETLFGINVAKVRELIQRVDVIKVPHAPPAVDGSFKLREEVLTLINLGRYLGIDESESDSGLVIIVEMNKTRCGIWVDAVQQIHRLRWDQVAPPSDFLSSVNAPLTATATIEKQVVQVLDFETVVGELLGTGIQNLRDEAVPGSDEPKDALVLVADDSVTVRDTLESVLRRAGYANLLLCGDGQQAWDVLEASRAPGGTPVGAVLSDIEMPRIDGLHLTSRIREHPDLRETPVILFSSIIRDEHFNKGQSVGANAQVSKTDIAGLLGALEKCLAGRETASA